MLSDAWILDGGKVMAFDSSSGVTQLYGSVEEYMDVIEAREEQELVQRALTIITAEEVTTCNVHMLQQECSIVSQPTSALSRVI